jgi:tetratricopeptide (TPR) repeat protein
MTGGTLAALVSGALAACEKHRLPDLVDEALRRAHLLTDHDIAAAADILLEAIEPGIGVRLIELLTLRHPRDARQQCNLAAAMRMAGNLGGALQATLSALALDPANVQAWHLFSDLAPLSELDQHVSSMAALEGSIRTAPASHAQLNYALGNVLHRLGEHRSAFVHFSRGAERLRRGMDYSVEAETAGMQRIAASQSARALAAIPQIESDAMPIFVCGLPRSGTTLVEQWLLRSGTFAPAGESSALSFAVANALRRDLKPPMRDRNDALSRLLELDLQRLASNYIANVTASIGPERHFIDKALLNFLMAGMITRMFPQGKTIQLVRDPRDSLVSIFRTYFAGLYPWALSLTDLAVYIKAFRRLAEHWQEMLPSDLYVQVSYSDVVTQPEKVGQEVCCFVGVDWNENYLDPASIPSVAISASASQVRQPIHTRSIGAWRSYEPWIGEALEILDR